MHILSAYNSLNSLQLAKLGMRTKEFVFSSLKTHYLFTLKYSRNQSIRNLQAFQSWCLTTQIGGHFFDTGPI